MNNKNSKNDIILALKETNPWWVEEFAFQTYRQRDIYKQIARCLPLRQVIAFVGLRRTGKTTLMLKIIDDFLKKGFPSKNILYFSFDDFSDADMREIISVYQELLELDTKNGKFLFLFDEIQKLTYWEEKVKRIYDAYPNIKIIVSGSESLFIRQKSRESLGGRIFEFNITPLTFKEFIRFRERHFTNIVLQKDQILKEFKVFVKTNGFPEIINIRDDFIINKYIKENILDKVIYKDLSFLFGVRDLGLINSILRIIMNNPGQILNIVDLSKELAISRQTLSLYLEYLEKCFLIKKLYNFSKNIRKSERSLKKYYPTIVLPVLARENFPKAFETMMALQLGAEYFYRDPQRHEVDVIKIEQDTPLPVEIKTGRLDFKSLKYFMEKYRLKKAVCLTYDQDISRHKGIEITSFYKYLL